MMMQSVLLRAELRQIFLVNDATKGLRYNLMSWVTWVTYHLLTLWSPVSSNGYTSNIQRH